MCVLLKITEGDECAACEGAAVFKKVRTVYGTTETIQKCELCIGNTAPSPRGDHCIRCNVGIRGDGCQCQVSTGAGEEALDFRPRFIGGICFQPKTEIKPVPESSSLYQIQTDNGVLESWYFSEHLQAALALCFKQNLTACQVVGNLCVLTHYIGREGSSPTPCGEYAKLASDGGLASISEWPKWMPWLYYVHSARLDESNDIPTQFTFARGARNSKLRLWAARYQLNGTFLGLAPVTGGLLQLCRSDKAVLDAAFVFGRSYEQTCSIPVRDLWDSYELEFADLYLEIVEGETRKLYPIPVLNQNLNRNSGVKKQEYVRRIFLVDNVSGRVSSAGFHSKAQVVRYLKSFTLHIQLQATKDGRIFPPYVEVEYDQVRVEEYDDEDEKKRETRFAVTYRMETFRHEKDLEIALGTLCSFGVLWTLLRTLAWSRRAGKSVVDFASVAKFILVLAGTLSDIFFIVCLATSLWILVSYKNQLTVVYMVLSRDQELSFTVYVGVACALKAVEMFNLVLEQVGAETFFIDWERPRGQVMPKQREGTAAEAGGGGDDPEAPPPPPPAQPQDTVESPITIWRTYLVANEWAELSSYRSLPVLVTSPVALLVSLVILGKTSYTLQLFAMVVLLKAAQLENIALVEPDITWGYVPKEFADSRMNRFGLAAALYLALGLFQWFVNVFIVERCFVNHFGNFVDLCSIGNISVLCLTRPQFGYYIHGRSVHGHSDTNMREMNEMLQRERDNLCSRRGLETNDDIQTFTVVLPPSFREAYENVVAPLRNKNPAAGRVSGEDLVTVQTETVIGVYERLNAFLTSFVEKRGGWKYGVRDRTALEAILDIDFGDTSVSADFLRDISEAGFSAAFLYGHEWTQLSFDALVFCTADLVLHDFLLAAAITFLVVSIIRKIRGQGGVRRLVRTSLVDKRFLI